MTELTFEVAYRELEQIVERLEGGKLPVDESVKLFRRGVELTKLLRERLKKVENEVKEIKKELGGDSAS